MNALVNPIEFSDLQAEYVLSEYAAYEKPEEIYLSFREAFPKAIDLLSEEYGEQNVREPLMLAIKRMFPGHPEFNKEKYGVLFDVLRSKHLDSIQDSFLGHSVNRLKKAEEILEKLENHAEEYPDTFTECYKLSISVLKEARAEEAELAKVANTTRPQVTPEEVQYLISKLDEGQLEEFTECYEAGEDPVSIIKRMQSQITEGQDG